MAALFLCLLFGEKREYASIAHLSPIKKALFYKGLVKNHGVY